MVIKLPAHALNYLMRHWQGELSLGQAFWYGASIFIILEFAIGLPVLFSVVLLLKHGLLPEDAAMLGLGSFMSIVYVVLMIWWSVGIWRSAGHYQGGWLWSTAARAMVILWWLPFLWWLSLVWLPSALRLLYEHSETWVLAFIAIFVVLAVSGRLFRWLRVRVRYTMRVGVFSRALKAGMSDEQARAYAYMRYPPNDDDKLHEARLNLKVSLEDKLKEEGEDAARYKRKIKRMIRGLAKCGWCGRLIPFPCCSPRVDAHWVSSRMAPDGDQVCQAQLRKNRPELLPDTK